MSGSEWTNDEPERRDDARPLSPEVEADPETVPIPGVSRAPAQPAEPAMAQAPSDRDESAPAQPPEGAKAGPRKPRGSPLRLLALLAKIPLPSLGSERHEMMPDAPLAAPAEGQEPGPTAPRSHPGPKRAPVRFPFLAMKRETRVGIAALVSFLFLVTALVIKKGWIGGKPITVAIGGPTKGDPESHSPEAKPTTPGPDSSAKNGPKPDGTKDKPAAKVKKEPREPGSELAPSAGDEAKPPAPVPDEPASSRLTLAGDPTATEPLASPPTGPETTRPATLANTTPTTVPPAFPADLPPGAADLPPDPAAAQLPTVGEMPASSPPAPTPATTEPTPTAPTEPSMLPVEARPPATELNPPPPTAPPPAERPQAPPVLAETTPPPIPTPAPTPPPPPASAPIAAAAPVLAEQPPKLDPVPAPSEAAGTVESAATKTSTVGAVGAVAAAGAGWVVIQSGGRRVVGASPIVSTPSGDQADPPRVADGPRVSDDLAADQVEPVVHVVRAGENFWTISKLYYRSGRFYRALHAANRRQVPKIDQLYVGTVLRIPPPEALDRSLIDPPGPSTSTVSRTSKRVDTDQDDLAAPAVRPRMIRPDPEAVEAPRRPNYTVKPHETLRSIARDTLNDPRRDREIYNLNRDVLNDINVLEPGTTLTLPEDAVVGRRSR